jgi:erythronate-4-phosphate dehydrogenase
VKLVVDENIPCAADILAPLGEVCLLPGRAIDAAAVRDAEVLLVRSVTRVDAALVAGSRLRFVGTATAGVDHVETDALAVHGIHFVSAPGSNADSVVDYVLSALAVAFPGEGELEGRSVGIIGCGEVGSRLLRRLRGFGLECVPCDPLRSDVPGNDLLEHALACDVISLHVPLTREGEHRTLHLLNEQRLWRLREDVLLLNTARGPVVDNAALLACLRQRSRMRAVLDVWETEPDYEPQLLAACLIGTPHIAGYAADGKRRGAMAVIRAALAFCGAAELLSGGISANGLPVAGELPAGLRNWQQGVLSAYDVRADDARLRASLVANPALRGVAFDRLRKEYPERREFSAWRCRDVLAGATPRLRALGFAV